MMADDGEDENGLRYAGFFVKASGCQFFKASSWARKSLKFCKKAAAVWIFFKKLRFII